MAVGLGRLYPSSGFYTFAVVEDVILRFSWAILVPIQYHFPHHNEIFVTVFGVFEVFRRFMWNFFRYHRMQYNHLHTWLGCRVETEHLNSCHRLDTSILVKQGSLNSLDSGVSGVSGP